MWVRHTGELALVPPTEILESISGVYAQYQVCFDAPFQRPYLIVISPEHRRR